MGTADVWIVSGATVIASATSHSGARPSPSPSGLVRTYESRRCRGVRR